MTHPRRFVALLAIISASVYAATSEPNAQPNPYRTIENWAKLPDGRTWGSAAGVDIDFARPCVGGGAMRREFLR